MAKRKKIIFPFYNTYFTATSIIIYQANILKTLQFLPDEQKPEITVWHNRQSPLHELKDTGYPYIRFINIKEPLFRFKKLISLLTQKLGMKNLFAFNSGYDIIYPADQDPFAQTILKKIYWKADFQENYYPENFLPEELRWVRIFFAYLRSHPADTLVLSSNACIHDLRQFYPDIRNPVQLYRFVSHVPVLNNAQLPPLVQRYKIRKPYYIVCNQFWPHKNHRVVIQALKRVMEQQSPLPFQFVFTGKTSSRRGDEYFQELKKSIGDFGLGDEIIITDFMERTEQLLLMKNAISVVQPTLFEGWSTVIEDAKALGKFVIASSLPVNREQISGNVSFFDPHDDTQLASLLLSQFNEPPAWIPYDYAESIQSAIEDLVRIFKLQEPGASV